MNVKELILGGEDYPGIPRPDYYNWLKGAFRRWPRRQTVDRNTWLDAHSPDTPGEIITVTLHQTPIITVDPQRTTATVQAGQWHTDVTADRLNNWLPCFGVYLRAKQPRQLCWDVNQEATRGEHPQQTRWRKWKGEESDVYLSDGDWVDYQEGTLHTLNARRSPPAPTPPPAGVQEARKKKDGWDSTKQIFARLNPFAYYRRCAKCGSVFGMFKSVPEAQLNNYCHSCYLALMDKISKEVAELTGRR